MIITGNPQVHSLTNRAQNHQFRKYNILCSNCVSENFDSLKTKWPLHKIMTIIGRFQCRCGNIWTNIHAEKGTSQECRQCHSDVEPQKVMFGTYKCKCSRTWRSRNAVEDSTQKCRECGDNVRPTNLEEVRMFGLFQCPNPECSHEWASASAWVGYTQGCIECGEDTYAYELRHLHRKREHSDSEVKPHIERLCGKCKELGYNCTKH